jgi:glucose-1-phosphatase
MKNIIFDLGGVVLNLDINRSLENFRKLGLPNIDSYFTQNNQVHLFDKLDKGKISGEEFLEGLSGLFPTPPSKTDLEHAWNSMILDLPAERLEFLLHLKEKYNTFLLSNTNEIHLSYFFKKLYTDHGIHDLSAYFKKEYYSCRMGMRKPDSEIFEHIIKENKLNPAETLFIDDTMKHVEGARKVGLIGHHLVEKEGILGFGEWMMDNRP